MHIPPDLREELLSSNDTAGAVLTPALDNHPRAGLSSVLAHSCESAELLRKEFESSETVKVSFIGRDQTVEELSGVGPFFIFSPLCVSFSMIFVLFSSSRSAEIF